MEIWLYLALVAALAALILAAVFARQVNSSDPGSDRMQELMAAIREGAMAFIRREYTAVAGFVLVMAILIFVLLDWGRPWGAVAYISGAVLSALAGFIGMRIATAANARTAEAARQGGIEKALPLAFRGGAVEMDRDLVLRWRPRASARPQAGVFRERFGGEEDALLMLVPPTATQREDLRLEGLLGLQHVTTGTLIPSASAVIGDLGGTTLLAWLTAGVAIVALGQRRNVMRRT